MTRFTEQTEGAKQHNAAQSEEARRRDAELLALFESRDVSLRAFARELGVSPQRVSVRLQRARAARDS
jgi:predicted ArsR family transcriptional regulator